MMQRCPIELNVNKWVITNMTVGQVIVARPGETQPKTYDSVTYRKPVQISGGHLTSNRQSPALFKLHMQQWRRCGQPVVRLRRPLSPAVEKDQSQVISAAPPGPIHDLLNHRRDVGCLLRRSGLPGRPGAWAPANGSRCLRT